MVVQDSQSVPETQVEVRRHLLTQLQKSQNATSAPNSTGKQVTKASQPKMKKFQEVYYDSTTAG